MISAQVEAMNMNIPVSEPSRFPDGSNSFRLPLSDSVQPTLHFLLSAPSWCYPIFLPLTLPLFVDKFQILSLALIISSQYLPSTLLKPEREAYMGRVAMGLGSMLEYMDRDTMRWRANEWLDKADRVKIAGIEGRKFLLVSGSEDKALPSTEECERLEKELEGGNKVSRHVVYGSGHGGTMGSRVNVAQLMRDAFEVKGGEDGVMGEREGIAMGMVERKELREDMRKGMMPCRYYDQDVFKDYT
ncbi:hypothetical protein TrRE_jg5468 [Triparma retinervis]|uniref:Uncharacterized protein n=1 Tax=Triparma retinervis TaxID=2557542 RepID=A0A9W7CDH9_9STRA|nr:hypothetical protein TrRE_jg5468 [Triparma retinervis]